MMRAKQVGPFEVIYGRGYSRSAGQSAMLTVNGFGVQLNRAGAVCLMVGSAAVGHVALGDWLRADLESPRARPGIGGRS
jgi:hypothetical protein